MGSTRASGRAALVKGSVRRRGRTWAITYDEPTVPGAPRKQRTKSGFASAGDAQRYLREQLRRIDTATYAPPEKTTIERYLAEEWLPSTRRRVRPLTYARYESLARVHVIPHIRRARVDGADAGASRDALR
jgi:Phage integrase, N-terminal SAM-like domain/Arm DNA-binding domain